MHVSLIAKSYDAGYLNEKKIEIPLFLERVSAGFPSPAQDYIEQTLDLNELCIQHPAATFFARLEGDSMIELGMYPNDIVVVDRSIQAKHGHIVVAALNGELTVKELDLERKLTVRLLPHNKNFQPIEIPEGCDLDILGVVTGLVRRFYQKHNFKI